MRFPGGPIALLLLVFFSLPGCLSQPAAPEFQQLTAPPAKPICRLLLLPFTNQTDYPQGERIIYRIFLASLSRQGGFTVLPEGDVRKVYRQMKLGPKDIPSHEQVLVLAERLGAEAVISGAVVVMREESGAQETKPELALDMRLTPVGSSKPMLTTYHRRSGEDYRKVMHFGLVNTMTTLAGLVADEIIAQWLANGLTPCAP